MTTIHDGESKEHDDTMLEKIEFGVSRLVFIREGARAAIHSQDAHDAQEDHNEPNGPVSAEIGFKPGHAVLIIPVVLE
jgi:hypothetical protein